MAQSSANVFLIDGEDDFGVAEFINGLKSSLGDPEVVELNTTQLDGRNLDLDDLRRACYAMPFLSEKRLVIVQQPTVRLTDKHSQAKFKKILESIPDSTLLILSHSGNLTEVRDRRKNKVHWLERLFLKDGNNYFYKHFDLPRSDEMVKWIRGRVMTLGGQITPAASMKLTALVGNATRQADQEIRKLLDYVNYDRAIELDDVEYLTPDSAPVGDFALVDALRSQNAKQAQLVMHKLLEDQAPLWIFTSITSQFRQLILVRELMEQRVSRNDIVRKLSLHPYVADLAMEHARHFDMNTLEKIYQQLCEYDYAIKTGQIDGELALDLLVIELSENNLISKATRF